MSNRKAATAELLKYIDKLLPGSENTAVYKQRLEEMSDAQFGKYMAALESGEEILSFIYPNLSDKKLSVKRNLDIAKELGHEFLQRLWLTDPVSNKTYLSPVKYLVVDLPLRRQAQLLVKKISIPEDNKHVDDLTGQPTGVSKGSKLSFPELQMLYAQGFDSSIEELIKFRGGDQKAFNAMNRQIMATGGVSLDSIRGAGTTVKSTVTLATILKSMHLDNNLVRQ